MPNRGDPDRRPRFRRGRLDHVEPQIPSEELRKTPRQQGGKLRLLSEIPPRDHAHPQDTPRVAYFRCERCAQIKIVER